MKFESTSWLAMVPGMREVLWACRVVARYAYLLIIGALLVGGATYFWTSRQIGTYRATAIMLVAYQSDTGVASSTSSVASAITLARTYAASKSLPPTVIAAAQASVPQRTRTQIQADLSVVALTGQPLISITAKDTDAQIAKVLANTVAFALAMDYTQQVRKAANRQVTQLQSQIDTLSTTITNTNDALAAARQKGDPTTDLQTQLQQEQAEMNQLQLQLGQAQLAVANVQPTFLVSSLASSTVRNGPNLPFNTSLGALAGALTGLGLALSIDFLDGVVRRGDDLDRRGNIRLLGEAPRAPTDAAGFALTRSMYAAGARAFRQAWRNLQFLHGEYASQVLLVVPVERGSSDDWAAINLAVTSAFMGQPTLLLDANWLRPTVETRFKLSSSEWGFFSSLAGIQYAPEGDWLASEPTDVPGLFVLPVGSLPPQFASLMQPEALADLFAELRKRFPQIVVLAPPEALRVAGGAFAGQIDSALVVAESGRTSLTDMKRVLAALEAKQIPVPGAVLLVAADSRRTARITQPLGNKRRRKSKRPK